MVHFRSPLFRLGDHDDTALKSTQTCEAVVGDDNNYPSTISSNTNIKPTMTHPLPTSPVQSFTYIGSFTVETEDEDDDVPYIPPSPTDHHDGDGDDDDGSSIVHDTPTTSIDNDYDSSVVDDEDGGRCIDHTALLLGGDEYEEEDEDDEREWNASFSLDELERNNDSDGRIDEDLVEEEPQSPPHAEDDDDDHHRELNYNDFAEQEQEDEHNCTSNFLNLDNGMIAPNHLPVSSPSVTIPSTNNITPTMSTTTTMQQVQPPPPPPPPSSRHQQVLRHASSLPTTIYSVTPTPPTTSYPSLRRHDTTPYNIIPSSEQPSMIQNDVWRREEEEQQAYSTMPRKKINTFENKKKLATMKALAMKERASSALVSRATRAKDKLKGKMTLSSKNAPVQIGDDDNGDDRFQNQQSTMEISTRDHDNRTNNTTLVSPSSLSSNLPTPCSNIKTKTPMSRAISSLSSSDTPSPKTSYYGFLSQRARRAKVKALGTMNVVLAATVSSTSSATSSSTSTSSSSMIRRQPQQQSNNDKKLTKQHIIDTVFSMEDEDNMSDIPSVLNSEGPNSIQDVSYDGSSIAMGSVRSSGGRGDRSIINNNNTVYSTPNMKRGARKNCGGNNGVGIDHRNHNGMDETVTADMISPSHIYSPEQILANLSSISSRNVDTTATSSTAAASCNSIDGDGFLISPSSASGIHRRWNEEEDGGGGDIASSSSQAAILPTVGSAVSSEGGGSTFDPNSFLFLSPLSDHDVDDPDYGMPFLLSRSNSHNAVVMDSTPIIRPSAVCLVSSPPPPPPPGPPISTSTSTSDNIKSSIMKSTSSSPSPTMSSSKKLLLRFPPSPRVVPSPKLLPPSGKMIMKKIKLGGVGGGAGGSGGSSGVVNVKYGSCLNAASRAPPLIQNRAQSSTF